MSETISRGDPIRVVGAAPSVTATMVRPGQATAFTAGDAISNSLTAGSVVPIDFSLADIPGRSGVLAGCRCVVTAASGTIVIATFAFDLMLFRPETDIPFAAGSYLADNTALNISAAAMKQCVGIFSFTATGWRNQAGANAAAGDHVMQSVPISASVSGGTARNLGEFNIGALSSSNLRGLMQAQGAWNPGNVAQTFDFALDVLGG